MKLSLAVRALVHSATCVLLCACGPAGGTPAAVPQETATTMPWPAETVSYSEVRQASGPGRWYPADPQKLAVMVDTYLAQADVGGGPAHPEGEPIALLVPHAGYIYSGGVAARAYRQLEGVDYDLIVIIGDTHSGNGSVPISVYAAGVFETPLGLVPIDEEVAQALVAADERIEFDREAFTDEHPVENQLPFLQRIYDHFKMVPIVIRDPSLRNIEVLSEALVKALAGKHPLIIGSSDMSHYPTYEDALRVDQATLSALQTLQPEQFMAAMMKSVGQGIPQLVTCLCSQGAVLTTMTVARELGANQATVLGYANSGDSPFGDRSQVVGYGAVMLWHAEGAYEPQPVTFPEPPEPPSEPVPLDSDEQETLLSLARQTISQFLETGTVPPASVTDPNLFQQRGAFVTLEKKGQLRGCIGRLVSQSPLYLTVQYSAISAAVNDARFRPVTPDELDEIEIEISVLSPIRPIGDVDEIEVGRHGLIIVKGERQGVLLPQVAAEEGWDREEYLRQVCLKAGLPEDAWREGAYLFVFTVEVFGEKAADR